MSDSSRVTPTGNVKGAVAFGAVALLCVVAGGLVAAVTGPLHLGHGSWAAAYLVLVGGVAQGALGISQYFLAPHRLTGWKVVAELVAWNGASAAVMGGTLAGNPWVVDAGGVLLVAALALMFQGVRGPGSMPGWALWGYRILVAAVAVSIPVGLFLAHLRAQ
ncbi:ABC-type multidrug transport system permease subunit [Pseudarthrobacter defluvii]|uniref:hypothetical protein n=1 Tax=Pseudarthrobacter defluvii TaxID=410837 RepID=UPI00277F12C1|nr:hypothetical protein [Pseudarthrobacter defluvii]MDQ0768900.1 ABC-type multidrug transport system permease subunit [Pseudarthrobacter defluvii]